MAATDIALAVSLTANQGRPTMITKRTVLILGAGSNVHLGYPLGTGLVSEICSRARAKLYSKEVAEKFSPEQIETFWKRLSRSGFPSIDAFLEHNPSDSELGGRSSPTA